MSSEIPSRSAPRWTRISRVGDGYALTASRLYVWDESLDEACAWGAELGAMPFLHRTRRRAQPTPATDRSRRAAPPAVR